MCRQDGLKGKRLWLSVCPEDLWPLGWMTDLQQTWGREIHLQDCSATATTECLPSGPDSSSVLLLLTSWAAAVKEVLGPQLLLPVSNTHPAVVRPCRETTLRQCLRQERVEHYLQNFSLAEAILHHATSALQQTFEAPDIEVSFQVAMKKTPKLFLVHFLE